MGIVNSDSDSDSSDSELDKSKTDDDDAEVSRTCYDEKRKDRRPKFNR